MDSASSAGSDSVENLDLHPKIRSTVKKGAVLLRNNIFFCIFSFFFLFFFPANLSTLKSLLNHSAGDLVRRTGLSRADVNHLLEVASSFVVRNNVWNLNCLQLYQSAVGKPNHGSSYIVIVYSLFPAGRVNTVKA